MARTEYQKHARKPFCKICSANKVRYNKTTCSDACDAVREKNRKRRRSNNSHAAVYGIPPNLVEEFKQQPCAICGKTSNATDHCHVTMEVRGRLCNTCNLAIGMMQDSPELLQKAACYVETNRTGWFVDKELYEKKIKRNS